MKVQGYFPFIGFLLVSLLWSHSLLAQAGVRPKEKVADAPATQPTVTGESGAATVVISTEPMMAPTAKTTNSLQEETMLTASGDRIVVAAKPDPLQAYRTGKSMTALELLKLDPAARLEVVDHPNIFKVEPQSISAAAVQELPVTLQLFVQQHAHLYSIR